MMRSPFPLFRVVVSCFALTLAVSSAAESPRIPKNVLDVELKATFLFRLGSYVEWSPQHLPESLDTLTICVLGKNPMGSLLDYYNGRPIHDRIARIIEIASLRSSKACNVIYLSKKEPGGLRLMRQFEKLKGVLTVSDREDFTCRGGMVRFVSENKRLALEISQQAATDAGLSISSQLLAIAKFPDFDRCRGTSP